MLMSNFHLLLVSRFGHSIPPDPLIYTILGFSIGIVLAMLFAKFANHSSDQSSKKTMNIGYPIVLSLLLLILSIFGLLPSLATYLPN